MITTSLQSRAEVYAKSSIIPTSFHWENYLKAWTAAPFATYYLNSAIMAGGIVIGHIIVDALAAYAFARLRFPVQEHDLLRAAGDDDGAGFRDDHSDLRDGREFRLDRQPTGR